MSGGPLPSDTETPDFLDQRKGVRRLNILHIGRKGNMERFSPEDSLLYDRETRITDLPAGLSDEDYLKAAPDTEHIIVDAIMPVSRALIEGFPSLRSIHSEGVAYNRIDCGAARERGVSVFHCTGMNAGAVAEQAILLMLGMLRNVAVNDRAVREGRQIAYKEAYMTRGDLTELSDLDVGLIGFGAIAEALAVRLRAFGVKNIYYFKRHRLPEQEEKTLGVVYKEQDELLRLSDLVSLHLPVTPDTIHTADEAFFSKMKKGSWFVNTARGELVDDEALVSALRTGRLKMAALDTLDNEPVTADHYLLQQKDIADRLLFSPHIGGITASSFRRGYRMIWEDIALIREGRKSGRCVAD